MANMANMAILYQLTGVRPPTEGSYNDLARPIQREDESTTTKINILALALLLGGAVLLVGGVILTFTNPVVGLLCVGVGLITLGVALWVANILSSRAEQRQAVEQWPVERPSKEPLDDPMIHNDDSNQPSLDQLFEQLAESDR